MIYFIFVHKPALACTQLIIVEISKGKDQAVLLQAWSGPEGSRKLRFPDFMTAVQDGGKFVDLTHWPPLPPGNTRGTHFCLMGIRGWRKLCKERAEWKKITEKAKTHSGL